MAATLTPNCNINCSRYIIYADGYQCMIKASTPSRNCQLLYPIKNSAVCLESQFMNISIAKNGTIHQKDSTNLGAILLPQNRYRLKNFQFQTQDDCKSFDGKCVKRDCITEAAECTKVCSELIDIVNNECVHVIKNEDQNNYK